MKCMGHFSFLVAGVVVGFVPRSDGPHSPAPAKTRAYVEDCRPLEKPKDLPRLDAVLDSLALLDRVLGLDTMPPVPVIVSVFLSDKPRAHIVDKSAPTSTEDLVLGHVLASLRPVSKNSPIAVRVHLRLGPARGISLERSVLCAPTALGGLGELKVPFFVGQVRGASPSGPPEPRSVTARIRVSADGHVLQVNLGSGTGIPNLDQAMREAILKQRYDPALLDGRPAEVWIEGKRIDLVR